MAKKAAGAAKPRIILTATDYEKLSVLADAASHTMLRKAAGVSIVPWVSPNTMMRSGRSSRAGVPWGALQVGWADSMAAAKSAIMETPVRAPPERDNHGSGVIVADA